MTKCDFCTESTPKGKCHWSTQTMRRDYCKQAILKMSKALGEGNTTKKGRY